MSRIKCFPWWKLLFILCFLRFKSLDGLLVSLLLPGLLGVGAGDAWAEISIPGVGPFYREKETAKATHAPHKQFVEDLRREVQLMGQNLDKIPHEKFPYEIDAYRGKVEQFIEEGRKVCMGDFSSFTQAMKFRSTVQIGRTPSTQIEGPATTSVVATEALNPAQRKSCFKELRIFHKVFMEKLLAARLKYLNELHSKRIAALKSSHQEALKNLELEYDESWKK